MRGFTTVRDRRRTPVDIGREAPARRPPPATPTGQMTASSQCRGPSPRRLREPAETAEIDRVLDDVGLEPVARQRAGGELGVEGQPQDRLAQLRCALPGFVGETGHLPDRAARTQRSTVQPPPVTGTFIRAFRQSVRQKRDFVAGDTPVGSSPSPRNYTAETSPGAQPPTSRTTRDTLPIGVPGAGTGEGCGFSKRWRYNERDTGSVPRESSADGFVDGVQGRPTWPWSGRRRLLSTARGCRGRGFLHRPGRPDAAGQISEPRQGSRRRQFSHVHPRSSRSDRLRRAAAVSAGPRT